MRHDKLLDDSEPCRCGGAGRLQQGAGKGRGENDRVDDPEGRHQAKVDLSAGSAKITTTDASGKTSQIEMGAAKVGEAELGVPFYPGASPAEGGSSKVSTPDGSMYSVFLQSADSPDKVAAFYRDRLKAMSAGKQMMDMSGGDGGANLMLADDKAKTSIQVNVMKGAKGTDVQIVASRPTAK